MSWFYREIRATLTDLGFDVFLENPTTYPNEYFTSGSRIDAIIIPPSFLNCSFALFSEIKSYDEYKANRSGWLKPSTKNQRLNCLKRYWTNQTIPAGDNAWAVIITGQLEMCFQKAFKIEAKKHPRYPMAASTFQLTNNNAQTGTLIDSTSGVSYSLKRSIICDSECHDMLVATLNHLGCPIMCDMKFRAVTRSIQSVSFNVIVYEKPNNSTYPWY